MSAMTGTSTARLSLVPLATQVLAELIRRVEPERVLISGFGLREGLLYRQMPPEMRRLDPLIEACRHMEATSARAPGFGEGLYEWLLPLYAGRPESELRLVRAACLLHDVNWRAHPDYRAELCLESVARANVAGVDHGERVFLGLALLNRYKAADPGRRRGALRRAAERRARRRRGDARPGVAPRGDAVGLVDRGAGIFRARPLRGAARPDPARPGARLRRRGGGEAPAVAGAAPRPASARSSSRGEPRRETRKAACTRRPLSIFPPRLGPAPMGRAILPRRCAASAPLHPRGRRQSPLIGAGN